MKLGTIGRYVVHYRRWYLVGALTLILVNVCDVALPLVLKLAIDDIVQLDGTIPLGAIAALYLGLVAVLAVFRYVWRLYFNGSSHRIANDLRRRLFEHLERLSPGFFNQSRTGDIMSRATADVEAVRGFYNQGLLLTLDTVVYLALMPPIMLWLSPKLTLLSLAPLPLIPLVVYFVGGRIRERSRRAQDLSGDLSAMVEQTIAGIRVVKSFAQEERQLERLAAETERLRSANMDVSYLQSGLNPAVSMIMTIGVVVVIVVGGRAAIAGEISVGDFVAFQHYLLKITWPMQAIGMTVGLYQRAFGAIGRIDEILETKPAIADGPHTEPGARIAGGAVALDDVTVAYEGTVPALRDVSIEIPAGKVVALVGPVGAGKTTLLSLVPRLVEPSAGAVTIDGRDVRRYPLVELRGAIAVVPQETFLFADTIAGNIAFGVPGATPEEIDRAAGLAQIRDEILATPGGYEALLGERGVTLSGGQRQRVAIARAIIRKPKILLLDDCLSSVDAETEERVLAGLREAMAGRTCVIASHRLSAMRLADEIIVLSEGRVIERGTHDALLARAGAYAELWNLQRLESELEAA